ncbi:hypothetical protein DUNSADRAFT_6639 [Dunaliella salina]|uniref:Encoded protein n=1 Tax=Dunaliella salina TaxID=3046 RepID=A0ABQ7FTV0_DUNSA|nr:hypothetical protein DUNSADRAFT_6639 [Dunaliella salina]|eukprot:KAF5825827.1 hypothetical protein DUNSADRAFT_6639 [Dunaliella salina]
MQSDMQSLPSQDLSSLEPFPAATPPSQHRLSLGHSTPPVNPLSSSWLPGLASANGGGSPALPPGLGWEGSSRENGTGSSRLSAWLRSDHRPSLDQMSTGSAVGASSLAAWGASSSSSRQQSLDGLPSIGHQEPGNPWGSSPLLGQYSGSQQDSAGSLLGLLR